MHIKYFSEFPKVIWTKNNSGTSSSLGIFICYQTVLSLAATCHPLLSSSSLQSSNEELERLRDSSKTSALVRSLRNQLEEQQASMQASLKSLKRVQEELDESVVQVDELTRSKLEVRRSLHNLFLFFCPSPPSSPLIGVFL